MLQMQAGNVYTAFGASVGVNTQLEKGVSKDTSERSTPKQSAYLHKAPRRSHVMLVDDARYMVRFSGHNICSLLRYVCTFWGQRVAISALVHSRRTEGRIVTTRLPVSGLHRCGLR